MVYLTFINEKVQFQKLFNSDELITYKNENDLIEKILDLKDDLKRLIKYQKMEKINILKFLIIQL